MAKPKDKRKTNLLLEHAFRQYHAPLYFYALKFVERQDVAKDLVQDAFLSLLSNENQKIDNLKAYLFQTVRNNCLNHIKHAKVKTEYQEKEQERTKRELQFYDTHKTLVEKELQEKLKEAIEELPEKYKLPLKMSRLEELSNKEIAQKLSLPLRTVETQIYRALKILREKVKNQGLNLFLFFAGK